MKKKKRLQNLQKKLKKLIKKLQKTSNELKKFNEKMKKIWLSAIALFMVIFVSCSVTRTTTTRSEFYQRGDTTVTIQTKTIESYNAEKKL